MKFEDYMLNWNEIGDEGCSGIGDGIRNLSLLKKLELHLINVGVEDDVL